MNMANEISIGRRRQVLEDGADVCNSESDSENEDHGDVLTGCYVGIPLDDQGNQLSASYKLSEQQAAARSPDSTTGPAEGISEGHHAPHYTISTSTQRSQGKVDVIITIESKTSAGMAADHEAGRVSRQED
jgi:hypothetical protein